MGAISGFCSFSNHYLRQRDTYDYLAGRMSGTLAHRGAASQRHIGDFACLSVRRDDTKATRMDIDAHENFLVVSDSEIYNASELRHLLASKGFTCKTDDFSEIILGCYLFYGRECANVINGVFAFAIWDDRENTLFLCRDRLGVKPLFYTETNGNLVFASEMKALFDFPGVNAGLDNEGLCEIFGLFPSRTEGFGVFKGIREIKYGHYGLYTDKGFNERRYWEVNDIRNDFSPEEALEHVRYLVSDAVTRQLETDRPLCAFLSGGLDSSIVTAIAARELEKQGRVLDTFSFDYEENDIYFQANDFQGDTDKRWAIQAAEFCKTNHHTLDCSVEDLAGSLYPAVVARDLPGMADVDASMLYFCKEVAKTHGVALTGECADELFGGYPWFHNEEAMKTDGFPWMRFTDTRKMLLSNDLLAEIDIDGYVKRRYDESVAAAPIFEGDAPEEKKRREIAYLNIKWFMTNLIDRTERCGMYSALSGRVPYADYRVVEFLWSLPWSVKCDGTPKSLLRKAFEGLLPSELINRKKSPFPKTYHPKYERILKDTMLQILNDPSSPILPFVDKTAVEDFLALPVDYGKPWFGQLMAAPQLIAFYIQLDYWLRKYSVNRT